MRTKFLICIFPGIAMIAPMLNAQDRAAPGVVHGFVVDASNGESLIGANVYLEGQKRGASTNVNGYFAIPKIAPGKYTLICRYIGYATYSQKITIQAGVKLSLKIALQPETLQGQEVVVYAEGADLAQELFAKPVSKVELGAREIRQIPQIAEADLLRSLQTIPGILPISDFSSALYIRGGTPDQNLYLLDGTDVYNPEHAFGLFSTFNTDAIKNVELSKGGFGAEYGDRLSSIIEITNLDGNRKEFEGRGAVSMLSARTTLQMPIGAFGSLSASIRRTYFDKTVARFIEDIPDYYFYDGNVKAFFDLSSRNKLSVSVYGGRDVLDLTFNKDAPDESGFSYDWGNTTGSIHWTRVFSPQLFANFWLTGSRFSSDFLFEEGTEFSEDNFISDVSLKSNLNYYLAQNLALEFGFEHKSLHGIYKQKFPGGRVDVDKQRQLWVGYLQANWQPTILWDVEAGVRLTSFQSDEDFIDLAPRLAIKRRMGATWSLKAATGVYYQYLHKIPRPFFADIWTSSDRFNRPSQSIHYIAGFQKDVAQTFALEIEAYYKSYENLHSFKRFITDITADEFTETGEAVYTEARGLFDRADGHSVGAEVMLKKTLGSVTGWLGYSLVQTEYTIDGVNQGKPFPPRHDRTSTVNLVMNIDVKNALRGLRGKPATPQRGKWRLGVNFVYSTGQPITVPASAYQIGTFPDIDGVINFRGGGFTRFAIYPSSINGYRLPAYSRLDVSLAYVKRFRHWSLRPYLQVFNIGNRKNAWFVRYEDESTEDKIVQTAVPVHMFPVLPTLGVNFEF